MVEKLKKDPAEVQMFIEAKFVYECIIIAEKNNTSLMH
jgi:hypothetical protein